MKTLKEKPFGSEKELEEIVDAHLEQIFGVQLIKNQYRTGSDHKETRILDTLAYDKEEKAFVAIEYKKDRDRNASLQLDHYLDIIANNNYKHLLLTAYAKATKEVIEEDWKSYGIIVGKDFTEEQIKRAQDHTKGRQSLVEVIRYASDDATDLISVHRIVGDHPSQPHALFKHIHTKPEEKPAEFEEEASKTRIRLTQSESKLIAGHPLEQCYRELRKVLGPVDGITEENRPAVKPPWVDFRENGLVIAPVRLFSNKLRLYLVQRYEITRKKVHHKCGKPRTYSTLEEIQADLPNIEAELKKRVNPQG